MEDVPVFLIFVCALVKEIAVLKPEVLGGQITEGYAWLNRDVETVKLSKLLTAKIEAVTRRRMKPRLLFMPAPSRISHSCDDQKAEQAQ